MIVPAASAGRWTSFTDMNAAAELLYHNNYLWGATPGGVFALDSNGVLARRITNIEGLRGLDLTSIEVDSSGNIWFGTENGTLNKFDSDGNYLTYYPIFDHPNVIDEPKAVFDLCADGKWLWIGREDALSKFDIYNNRGEIKENIQYMGPFSNPDVKVCFVDDSRIWFGCENCIGFADKTLDFPYPDDWTVFHAGNPAGLGNFNIKAIVEYDGIIFAGTAEGVYGYDNNAWTLSGLDRVDVNKLRVFGDTLFAATDEGVSYYINGAWQSYQMGDYTGWKANDLYHLPGSKMLVALTNGGLLKYDGSWELMILPGPRGQIFRDIAAAEDNVWIVALSKNGRGHPGPGVNHYDGSSWEVYNQSNSGLSADWAFSVAMDSSGYIWIGHWGRGADRFYPVDSTWTLFDRSNSPLWGVFGNPAYIAVSSIGVDEDNNVWLSSYNAEDPTGLFILKRDSTWFEILESTDGLRSNWVNDIEILDNYLIVSHTSGIDFMQFGSDFSDTTEDPWTGFKTSSGLASNDVEDSDMDNNGIIWIGTLSGLNFYNTDPFYQEIDSLTLPFNFGPAVKAIEVDPLGNKWIGTSDGLLQLSGDNSSWNAYTTQNSGLVNNDIISLAIESGTSNLWIGTTGGISRFDTGIQPPSEDLSDIGTYPSPAGPRFADQVTFAGVPFGAHVYIYTIAGEKITDFPAGNNGGLTSWNYRNQAGDICAGGIYIYHVRTSDNEYSTTGKFVLIR
jgi:ligand-binding sensor domain-containing protein